MWLLRQRLSDFNLKKNNLTVQEWTKSYIELIALYVHPNNTNHLLSHLRAIMALDHSRFGLENKFLGNKSRRSFCVRQVCLKKIWRRVDQPIIILLLFHLFHIIILFIHHIRGETVLWSMVFIIQTSDSSISQFRNTNCTHSIFRTIEARVGF